MVRVDLFDLLCHLPNEKIHLIHTVAVARSSRPVACVEFVAYADYEAPSLND